MRYTIITHQYLGFGVAYFIGWKRITTKNLPLYLAKHPEVHLVFKGWPKEMLEGTKDMKVAIG